MIRNTTAILATALVVATLTGTARAQEVSVESLPPSVIKTVPTCGHAKVPATRTQIKVTFSKDMMDGSWSFTQISSDSFPEIVGVTKHCPPPAVPLRLIAAGELNRWANMHQRG